MFKCFNPAKAEAKQAVLLDLKRQRETAEAQAAVLRKQLDAALVAQHVAQAAAKESRDSAANWERQASSKAHALVQLLHECQALVGAFEADVVQPFCSSSGLQQQNHQPPAVPNSAGSTNKSGKSGGDAATPHTAAAVDIAALPDAGSKAGSFRLCVAREAGLGAAPASGGLLSDDEQGGRLAATKTGSAHLSDVDMQLGQAQSVPAAAAGNRPWPDEAMPDEDLPPAADEDEELVLQPQAPEDHMLAALRKLGRHHAATAAAFANTVQKLDASYKMNARLDIQLATARMAREQAEQQSKTQVRCCEDVRLGIA